MIVVISAVRRVVVGEAVTKTTVTEAKGDDGDDEGVSVSVMFVCEKLVDC